MKSLIFAAASLLSSFCHGTPIAGLHSRQGPSSYYGISGASGGVHSRMEIRELQKTGNMWNLFLLALTEFEAMDQNEIDSYYQIAGIHGMPWYSWDGVTFNSADGNPPKTGYCPHSQLLFGTWHRPYMALFEQKLQSIAIDIAGRFPTSTRAAYEDAANKLRLPYWDWAQAVPTSEPAFPAVLIVEKIEVTMPDNTLAEIDNPLFDYDFHPHDRAQINGTGCSTPAAPLARHPYMCDNTVTTVRKAPTPDVNVSDHAAVEKRYRQILKPQRQKLYSTLTQYKSFNAFSNSGHCGETSGWTLEGVHDPIHVEMAPGHMVPPAVAAFDPIFWLHHANVDRQMALFQALFPDTYIEQCQANTATWTIQEDEILDADSPLTPFHKNADGDWWTSANSRYITDMGYTYPELADKPSNETLVARINALYAGPEDGSFTKVKRQEPGPVKSQEYMAEVEMPMIEGFPYNVLIFVGDVGNNVVDWHSEESFVGNTATLGAASMKASKSTFGTVILTDILAEKIATGVTTEKNAVEYLKDNLKWRVELADAEISRDDIPGIKVTLLSTEVEKATSNTEFDRWIGGFERHGEVDV